VTHCAGGEGLDDLSGVGAVVGSDGGWGEEGRGR
jgi:hypothetical protein